MERGERGEPRTVLVADSLPPVVREILESEPSIRVVVKTGLPEEALAREVRGVAGLVVRSATKVTAPILEAADRLELVVRAGTGVDNIDVEAATRRGVVVMNVPGENTVSAAEHTMALLLSLVRRVPAADRALKAGKWERGLQGTELMGKTLGLVGCGRVGKEVAARAAAFGMRVLAYDPYLPEEAARRMGVTLSELPALLEESDVVSIHAPLTDSTKRLIGRPEIARMRAGAILVNCARGGLVDEEALAGALAAGRLGGAALDVFEKEPPGASPLVASERTVCTPHLGASTSEAQERVARRAAEQVLAYFRTGAAENAVNVPGVPPGAWPKLEPWVGLAERLGRLLGALAEGAPRSLEVEHRGKVLELPTGPITSAALAGYLEATLGRPVNRVSSGLLAKERGLSVREVRTDEDADYVALVSLRLETATGPRLLAGTLFGRRDPRLVRLDGYEMDARPEGDLLIAANDDRPGIIGRIGTMLGEANVNIAYCAVGRDRTGGRALAYLNVDTPVPAELADRLARSPGMVWVRRARL